MSSSVSLSSPPATSIPPSRSTRHTKLSPNQPRQRSNPYSSRSKSCVSPLSMVKRNTKKQLPLRSDSQALLARPAASFHLGFNLPSTPLNLVLASLKNTEVISVPSCLEYLEERERDFCIVNTFHEIFPRRFRTAAAALPHRSIKEAAEQLQEEFIKLVEQHYFPLDSWDTEWIRDRFPFIPIHLENYDCESEFEEVPLPICIAAAWVGHYSYAPTWTNIQEELSEHATIPRCFLNPQHRCNVQFLDFRRRCARRRFPISGFPQVIDILGHCTGSLFLDISYDCESPDHPYQWNKRDLKALARQWKRAQIMQQSMNSTTKALLDNPSAWETIFSCWSDLCTATHEAQT